MPTYAGMGRVRRDEGSAPEGGFTLVEMVVAVSVLALVMMAAANVLSSGLRALSAAKARARGNEIATQGIEDLQRFSFNNLGLCTDPPAPEPAGLEEHVYLGAGCATAQLEDPCHPTTAGTVPRFGYDCTVNNITYSVKRYVAWVDDLHTTKRLAVYVEWKDLAGNHQVSQQSSLRAPDQAAITGLAPPTFVTSPTSPAAVSPTAGIGGTIQLDDAGKLASGYTIGFEAKTTNLNKLKSTTLVGAIPAHNADDRLDITVATGTGFPLYNGFPVTIGTEAFTVVAGSGTPNWTVAAANAGPQIGHNSPIAYAGDQVYALVQTLGPNGSPQKSTVLLNSTNGVDWSGSITAADGHTFGAGSQYVTFGILRIADGKTTSAFSTAVLTLCPSSGCGGLSLPLVETVNVPSSVAVGAGGALVDDIDVEVKTTNITSADTVTMSFLTQAGSVTVALQPKSGTTCADSATAVDGVECYWTGRIAKTEGYRFTAGAQQKFFFGAQQVVDTLNPASIDKGSTGATSSTVQF
jgi:prepilin-type N-terminal cleavage/methylation domain-containing protein